jgi:hypothetical protein
VSRQHDLKCWPSHYEKVLSGEKPFEVRKNDRDFAVGDMLRLREWDPTPRNSYVATPMGYTKRETMRTVTSVLSGTEWGLAEGYCVLGLGPAPPVEWPYVLRVAADNCDDWLEQLTDLDKARQRFDELVAEESTISVTLTEHPSGRELASYPF